MSNPRLAPRAPLFAAPGSPPVEWVVSAGLTAYPEALAEMEARAERIAAGRAPERVWLLEHPPLYTAGASADPKDLLDPRFPVYRTGRGGQFTYHGPGQRVAYVMLDLKRRRPDVRAYVAALEGWLIEALKAFDVAGETREDRVGVWVARPDKPRSADGAVAEDKIAAIGVRLRRWASFHGVALNVAPDLGHFSGIVPCGIRSAQYRRDEPRRSWPSDDHGRGRRALARRVRAHVRADRRDPRRSLKRLFAPASDPMVRRCLLLPPRWRAGRSGAAHTPCGGSARNARRRLRPCTTRSSANGAAIARTASSIPASFKRPRVWVRMSAA